MRVANCRFCPYGIAFFLSLGSIDPAIAGPIVFTGSDFGAQSLSGIGGFFAMTNSVAAFNAWAVPASALGTIQTIDFESPYPIGQQTSVLLSPEVTLSITSLGSFTISNLPPLVGANQAFNTTPGGSFYAGLSTCQNVPGCTNLAIYTFSFTKPIQAFGLYVTGDGLFNTSNAPQVLSFSDPLQQSLALPYIPLGPGPFGGLLPTTAQFIGFTDVGAAISSVSLTVGASNFPNLGDSFAFDDVRFVTVPEPATVALLGLGLLGVVALRRRN